MKFMPYRTIKKLCIYVKGIYGSVSADDAYFTAKTPSRLNAAEFNERYISES